ncbi:VOC family protein, partial [Pseudonocardia eucalypti]
PAGLPIATSKIEVLRRPVEFALDALVEVLATVLVVSSGGHRLGTLRGLRVSVGSGHDGGGSWMGGPLGSARAITKIPVRDLERARRFYRDRLGLDPVEERAGGLRYVCGTTEFHLFRSSGTASGASTQIGFEVDDIDAVVAELRARGVRFEAFDISGFEVEHDIVTVPNNYPSKGSGERGAFFRDSEGNLLALGQAIE